MAFVNKTDEYYRKFIELQEKLRKSEEEKLLLEMKFNKMVQTTREEEQEHYKRMCNKYKNFLKEDKKRHERNEKIIATLERIETRVGMLIAKTDRFNMLRKQYQVYMDRISQIKLQEKRDRRPQMKRDNVSFADRSDKTNNLQFSSKLYSANNTMPYKTPVDAFSNYFPNNFDGRRDETKTNDSNLCSKYDDENTKLQDECDQRKADSFQQSNLNLRQPFIHEKFRHAQEEYKTSAQSNEEKNDNISFQSTPKQEQFKKPYGLVDEDQQVLQKTNFLQAFLPNENAGKVHLQTTDRSEDVNGLVHHNIKSQNMINELSLLKDKETGGGQLKESDIELFKQDDFSHDAKDLKFVQEPSTQYNDSYEILPQVTENELNLEEKISENYDERRDLGAEQLNISEPQQQFDAQKYAASQDYDETKNLGNVNSEEYNKAKDMIDKVEPSNIQYSQKSFPASDEDLQPVNDSSKFEDLVEDQVNIQPVEDSYRSMDYPSNELGQEYNEKNLAEAYQNMEVHNQVEEVGDKQIDGQTDATKEYTENEQHSINNEPYNQQYGDKSQTYDQQFDENMQFVQQLDETGQPIEQYHENAAPLQQYDENSQPVQQYDENGAPVHQQYDDNGAPIQQYDENGAPIQQYDENGAPVQQYDENGQPLVQYDEHGQPIQYDQYGQPIQYDEYGQQIMYDENGQVVQYNENGQVVQYNENGEPIQYYQDNQGYYGEEQGYDTAAVMPEQPDVSGFALEQHYSTVGVEQQYGVGGVVPELLQDTAGAASEQPFDTGSSEPEQQYDALGAVSDGQYDLGETGPEQQYNPADSVVQQHDIVDSAAEQQQDVNFALEQPQYDTLGAIPEQNRDVVDSVAEQHDLVASVLQEEQDVAELVPEHQYDTAAESIPEAEHATTGSVSDQNSEIKIEQPRNVMDMLDTDTESAKQDTKISNDSDFDFSNG